MADFELATPQTFARRFFATAENVVPRDPRQFWWSGTHRTEWFERVAQKMAEDAGLYCKNQITGGEWLNIDHVFVESNTYDSFPLIAAEHENMPNDVQGKLGALPVRDTSKTPMVWSLWKLLTVRAQLAVLVAYPQRNRRASVLDKAERILSAWYASFGAPPQVLMLFGWQEAKASRGKHSIRDPRAYSEWSPTRRFEVYLPSEASGRISVAEVPLATLAPQQAGTQ
jgi:hypothetical protein